MSLAETVVHQLLAAGKTLATAESCTGGLLAGALTSVPGSSGCFAYGLVTYSNAAKTRLLSVPEDTLEKYDAVSAQTVIAMAEGARRLAEADLALSVSGVAGPDGGTAERPVGLVYIGLAKADGTLWRELRLSGSRAEIRRASVEAALRLLLEEGLI